MLKRITDQLFNLVRRADDGPFTGALDQTFPGDIQPDMTPPDASAAAQAIAKLKLYQSGQGPALSEAEADSLIKWTVHNTRNALEVSYKGSIADESLQGACGLASGVSAFPLEDMGVQCNMPNIGEVRNIKNRHAFLTAGIPVERNGVVEDKHYLVDATYRQFCVERDPKNFEDSPGHYLSQSQEGYQMGTDLLKNGYVELTEENARLYVEAFNRNEPVTPVPSSYVGLLHEETRYYNDYDRDELDKWGMNIALPTVQAAAATATLRPV